MKILRGRLTFHSTDENKKKFRLQLKRESNFFFPEKVRLEVHIQSLNAVPKWIFNI